MLRLFIFSLLILFASEALALRTIEKGEIWSGKVVLDDAVRVADKALLTIKPGTEIRFSGSAALTVQGRVLANGTEQNPISFLSDSGTEAGSWHGISFLGSKEESELAHVRIEGAVQALTINGSKVSIVSSVLQSGIKGIYMGAEAIVKVDDVTIRNMGEVGIEASTHSQGIISNCLIETVGGPAILAGKQTRFIIRGNRISNAKVAILTSGDSPPIEENVISNCEVGIAITQASPRAVIRGNRISGAKTGISCQQFASPTIERNTIKDCDEGIYSFQGSSPVVSQNLLVDNRRALSAIQMCNPEVTRNDFANNDTAVYLHLSSYAVFQENNFEGNRMHIALDNMSYDWELRASKKPIRNRQMQNDFLVKQGRAMPKAMRVEVKSDGFVNARGNYWGEETTREMAEKGIDTEISTIMDGYDLPILTYDGWPGEYKKDRVSYADWQSERIEGTGP
jgi:parallel beta-helix repeat protein